MKIKNPFQNPTFTKTEAALELAATISYILIHEPSDGSLVTDTTIKSDALTNGIDIQAERREEGTKVVIWGPGQLGKLLADFDSRAELAAWIDEEGEGFNEVFVPLV